MFTRSKKQVSVQVDSQTTLDNFLLDSDKNMAEKVAVTDTKKSNSEEPQTQYDDTQNVQECLKSIMDMVAPIKEMNNKLDRLTDDMNTLKKNVEKNTDSIGELSNSLELCHERCDSLIERTSKLEQNAIQENVVSDLEKIMVFENKELQKKILEFENNSSKNSLSFVGIPESEQENCMDKVYLFLEKELKYIDPLAKERILITRAVRTGKPGIRPRPILATFLYYPHAMEIYKKRRMLKVSQHDQKFFIFQVFPEKIERIRQQLRILLKAAKKVDNKAYIYKDKLVFKKKRYSLQECYNVPELNIQTLGSIHYENQVLFHGRFCPLSNFYPAKFSIGGKVFWSNEQFFQYTKAMALGKSYLAYKIMHSDDPVEMKKIGDKLEKDLWPLEAQYREMNKGLYAKFAQNEPLKAYLKSTASKELIECNQYDNVWGNGKSIYDKFAAKGTGKNLLGKCLADVREML